LVEVNGPVTLKKGSINMFSGKGGVGKSTCTAATALHHALQGEQTLAISTDATPSLSHVFEAAQGENPVQVADSLFISELGVEEVKEMWEAKFGKDVYSLFSTLVDIDYPEFIDFTTNVLPGLTEEFMVDYIRSLYNNGEFDTVVWDTAPLGQTLALLATPSMLADHLKMAPRIYSKLRLGHRSREPILQILQRWSGLSAENMDFLRSVVRFNMVTIPEALAVEQLEGIFRELDRYGLSVERIIVNNVVKDPDSKFLRTRAEHQKKYLDIIHNRYAELDIVEIPMFPYEMKGIERLKEVEEQLFARNEVS